MMDTPNSLIDKRIFTLHHSFLIHFLRAGDAHSIHSPFVFSLYQDVIQADNRAEVVFKAIELRRKALRQNNQQIAITDFGAGSRTTGSRQATRLVADIARRSLKPARYGRLLYRLVRRFAAGGIVLELGTSLGLTTAYLSTAQPAQLITFEGCPETTAIAQQQFDHLTLSHIQTVVGNIDETLASALTHLPRVDLAFFDANHRFEPTVRYFEQVLPKVHNDSVFIFDDIHWSAAMEQAWATIQAHPVVTISIDLFGIGLIFFRREQSKQQFVLRF